MVKLIVAAQSEQAPKNVMSENRAKEDRNNEMKNHLVLTILLKEMKAYHEKGCSGVMKKPLFFGVLVRAPNLEDQVGLKRLMRVGGDDFEGCPVFG